MLGNSSAKIDIEDAPNRYLPQENLENEQPKTKPISVGQGFLQLVGAVPSTVDQEKRQHYLNMLKSLRDSGTLKGSQNLDTLAISSPEFLALLEKYDTNRDGHIDSEEIAAVLNDLKSRKQQTDLLKTILCGAFAFLIILLISNTMLTVWMIQLTKDVYVNDDDSTSMVNYKGDMLKTDKPKFFTSISSITRLPASALDAITRMTFTTVDSGVYNLLVNGVRMDAKVNNSVYIYFTSNKQMYIKGNTTAIFIDHDVVDGTPKQSAVVINAEDPLTTLSPSRRLTSTLTSMEGTQMVDSASERCFAPDVCLYTYEEMMSLFDEHAALEGRRLSSGSDFASSSSMTYTEITADAKILAKDDRAGLSRAQGFLGAVLAQQADLMNGTLKISFIMNDLCANYPDLRKDCRSFPAPDIVSAIDPQDPDNIRPFPGTVAEDGYWMFQDEVEYLLDSSSVQVKVRLPMIHTEALAAM